jgi:N-acetylmuramoyl-L-alanine amidase CwlD
MKSMCGRLAYVFLCIIISMQTALLTAPSPSLTIQGKSVELFTPIRYIDSVSYVPLRDVLPYIPATLQYSRKTDTYTFISDIHTVTIIPNSKEILLDATPKTLDTAITFIKGRIHIPIRSFFTILGYTVSYNKLHFSIDGKQKKPSNTVKKSSFYTTGNSPKPITKEINLPIFNQKESLFLSFEDKTYDISKSFFYKNQFLYIHLLPLLKDHNIKILDTSDSIDLIEGSTEVHFFKKKDEILVKRNGSTKKIVSEKPVVINKGTPYIKFNSFLKSLDKDIYWSSYSRTLHILSKMYRVDVDNTTTSPTIKLISSGSIKNISMSPLSWSKGYQITLPNTLSLVKNNVIETKNQKITEIKITQKSPHTTTIKLYSKSKLSSPYSFSTDTGTTLQFNATVTDIKEQIIGNDLDVIIKSSFPHSPKFSYSEDKKKLILDIPEAFIDIPQFIRSEHPIYKQIRSSQFSHDPLITRIVFDLHTPNTPYSWKHEKNNIAIRFKLPKKKTPHRKKTKISGTHISSNSLLANKVIVIDAGHGGRDPGAIGKGKRYEKNYTLDVARRLQRLLSSKGAFVIMTRSIDKKVGLNHRAYISNKNKADLFISIHFNSFMQSKVHGSETFYYKYKDKKLAQHLQKQMIKDLKTKNNGIKRARLFVLYHTHMPAALVEPGFLTNPRDFKKIKDPKFREKIAQSLYQGILNYYRENSTTKKR